MLHSRPSEHSYGNEPGASHRLSSSTSPVFVGIRLIRAGIVVYTAPTQSNRRITHQRHNQTPHRLPASATDSPIQPGTTSLRTANHKCARRVYQQEGPQWWSTSLARPAIDGATSADKTLREIGADD
jgi:hypothetical protein